MPMEPSALVRAAVEMLETFRPSHMTVDMHVKAALGDFDEVRAGESWGRVVVSIAHSG